MMQHLFITIRRGLPVTLEDGTKSRTMHKERTFVKKISADQFKWKDATGRVCITEIRNLLPPIVDDKTPVNMTS